MAEGPSGTDRIRGANSVTRDVKVTQIYGNRVQKMKDHFASQKKVRCRIRPEDGPQWVQVNGYAYSIQATGEYVDVPQQVYDMLVVKGVV